MNRKEESNAASSVTGKGTKLPSNGRVPPLPLVRQALSRFRKLTGMAAALVPPDALRTPVQVCFRHNEFCRALRQSCEGGCAECGSLQRELFRRLTRKLKVHSMVCGAGIIQFVVPVVVGGKHVATVVGGNVRVKPAGNSGFEAFTMRHGLQSASEDFAELRAAYFRSPLLTMAKVRASLSLLDTLTRLFGEALTGRPSGTVLAESPYLARAKSYVCEHLGERLTTRQVAQALHLSEAYFCRLFRRLTGTTFRSYLSQARVEAAKARLLNSFDPITDIGYVAGFQSVSDFNRVFKSRVGTSPSQFRREAQRQLAQTRSEAL